MQRLVILCIIVFSVDCYGATFTFQSAGDWAEVTNWDVYPGLIAGAGDTILIQADCTIQSSVTVATADYVEVAFGFSLTIAGTYSSAGDFVGGGDVTITGSAIFDGYTLMGGNVLTAGYTVFDTLVVNDLSWTNDDTIKINSSAIFLNVSDFTNNGVVEIEGTYSSSVSTVNNGILDVSGVLELPKVSISTLINNDSLHIEGSAVIEGVLDNTANGDIVVTSTGSIDVADGATSINRGILSCAGVGRISDQSEFLTAGGIIEILTGGRIDYLSTIPTTLSF